MKIRDLIVNDSFDFNVHYKIYKYVQYYDSIEEGDVILKYDSYSKFGPPSDICEQEIVAVNQADDGTVEIEYV